MPAKEEVQGALRWSPKIPGFKIRLLYERHAAGLLDDDLLNEVAWHLWERSRDIVIATDAVRGRATCPRCSAVLPHDGKPRTLVECGCGFQMRWRAYERSFRDRELQGGNATAFFRTYAEDLPRARTAAEKVILLDRVIHAAHVSVREGTVSRRAVRISSKALQLTFCTARRARLRSRQRADPPPDLRRMVRARASIGPTSRQGRRSLNLGAAPLSASGRDPDTQ